MSKVQKHVPGDREMGGQESVGDCWGEGDGLRAEEGGCP